VVTAYEARRLNPASFIGSFGLLRFIDYFFHASVQCTRTESPQIRTTLTGLGTSRGDDDVQDLGGCELIVCRAVTTAVLPRDRHGANL
jgi:hypothetical protein